MNKPESENPAINVFVSYATSYDSYEGSLNWNELTHEQRKTIAHSEFEIRDGMGDVYVMAADLKKLQASGIRSLYVASLMLNERLDLIRRGTDSKEHRMHVLSVFANTRFFREMNSLLTNTSTGTTDYVGAELERLAQTNSAPSLLDDALDMDGPSARRFIQAQLEVLHVLAPNDPPSTVQATSPSPLAIPSLSGKRLQKRRKWSWLDLFSCSEVRWIKDEVYAFFEQHDYLIGDQAAAQCIALARDSNKAKYSVRVDRMKPDQIALIIIRNVALKQVACGANHVYHGVLGQAGKEYKRIFMDAVREIQKRGYADDQETAGEIAEISTAIEGAG